MKFINCLLALTVIAGTTQAQKVRDTDKKTDKSHSISLTTGGLNIDDEKKSEDKRFKTEFAIVDLGVNSLHDKTDYTSADAKAFVMDTIGNIAHDKSMFSLRTGKSINVNVWPVMVKWQLLKSDNQKIHVGTGIGLQMYNFRFSKNISYRNDTKPVVVAENISFSKNKLGFTYLSVPFNLTFKTKLGEDAWLVYGIGATGGYRISSWTKQASSLRGTEKNHDKFNFSDFNGCLTAEFGIDGYFRVYGSYQVTALHEDALDQHPFCIGLRFGGI